MAWLESHQALERHPKVLQLASMMGWSLDETLGKLHRFWWWCLEYAPTGDLRQVDPIVIAGGIGLTGDVAHKFMPSMLNAHLICSCARSKKPFRVHDWIEYAGRYLRDTKFKRTPEKWTQVMELYAIACQPTVSRHVRSKTTFPVDMSAVPNQPTNLTNLTNQPTTCASGFEIFWNAYPRKKSKGRAEKAWGTMKPNEQLQARILDALKQAKTSVDWTKEDGRYIPHPATWLNAKGWEDEFQLPALDWREKFLQDGEEAHA